MQNQSASCNFATHLTVAVLDEQLGSVLHDEVQLPGLLWVAVHDETSVLRRSTLFECIGVGSS